MIKLNWKRKQNGSKAVCCDTFSSGVDIFRLESGSTDEYLFIGIRMRPGCSKSEWIALNLDKERIAFWPLSELVIPVGKIESMNATFLEETPGCPD